MSHLERVIIAKVPSQVVSSRIETPYGPPINPCDNSSMLEQDATSGASVGGCTDNGVLEGKTYTYVSAFKVMPSFPSVSEVETKFILRQVLPKHKKLSKYRTHPGPTVLCVVIPNIEVID